MTSRFGDDRGDANVEFAIYAPVVFVIFFALVQYGFYLHADAVVEQAAQHGLRYAAVTGDTAAGNAAIAAYIAENTTLTATHETAIVGDHVTTRVVGNVPSFVSFLNVTVTGEAAAPIEQFLTPDQRQ